MSINPLDLESLRSRFKSAQPFPHVVIENFLDEGFAREVASSYPTFDGAKSQGFAFNAVNERKKVQITDSSLFPDAARRLNDAISSPAFLRDLTYVTGIPNLLADTELVGGGIHITGPHGRLDVHVDFNLLEERKLYRRLNLLVYLNPTWETTWGGEIELWDREVRHCALRLAPVLNRCLLFETSNISFHGVAPLTCPPDLTRKSFAAYYYTTASPPDYQGIAHSTIFRARPDEHFRAHVAMPAERLQRRLIQYARSAKRTVRGLMALAAHAAQKRS